MEYDRNTLSKTITNAAKAHSQGVEVRLQARPFAGLGFLRQRRIQRIALRRLHGHPVERN